MLGPMRSLPAHALICLLLGVLVACAPARRGSNGGGGGDDDDDTSDDDDVGDDDDAAAGGTIQVVGMPDGTLTLPAVFAVGSAENSPGNLPVNMVVAYPALTCANYRAYYQAAGQAYEAYTNGEIELDEYIDAIDAQGESSGFFPGWGGIIQFDDEPTQESTVDDISLISFSETVPAPDGEGSLGDYDTGLTLNSSEEGELSITGTNGLQGSFVDFMTLVDQSTSESIGEFDVTISFDAPLCDLD